MRKKGVIHTTTPTDLWELCYVHSGFCAMAPTMPKPLSKNPTKQGDSTAELVHKFRLCEKEKWYILPGKFQVYWVLALIIEKNPKERSWKSSTFVTQVNPKQKALQISPLISWLQKTFVLTKLDLAEDVLLIAGVFSRWPLKGLFQPKLFYEPLVLCQQEISASVCQFFRQGSGGSCMESKETLNILPCGSCVKKKIPQGEMKGGKSD